MATSHGEFYRDTQDERDGQDFLMGDFWIPARQRRIYDFRRNDGGGRESR